MGRNDKVIVFYFGLVVQWLLVVDKRIVLYSCLDWLWVVSFLDQGEHDVLLNVLVLELDLGALSFIGKDELVYFYI